MVTQGSVLGPVQFVLYTQPLSQILFNHSCQHQVFADDTQLCKSCSPEQHDDTRNTLQTCISDIEDWMTDNKLHLNADKTETMLFNSSKLEHPPALLLICRVIISFSDSVRNLNFYLDKDLSMKEHINFLCKTAFLEIRRISTIHHYLTGDATKTQTLVVSFVLSRIDYCNSLLAGVPQSMVGKLQKVQNGAALLVVRAPPHVHVTPILRHLHRLPDRARISYKIACLCINTITSVALLISLTFYICAFLLDLSAPVRTPAISKFHSISARQNVMVLSLTLVLLSGTHRLCTLEMLQLSTPSSVLKNLFLQPPRIY